MPVFTRPSALLPSDSITPTVTLSSIDNATTRYADGRTIKGIQYRSSTVCVGRARRYSATVAWHA
eukprot:1373703-Rhodomonas_salina.1